eukprot:TRINITY_DN3956_c0_g1_i1.p1 TRINITY_DN3956_c0_g1~~TRINITY_DN3956_c0_g1_i1.p1  ORF type:complete len:370 (-),score=92.83 TRINITY_DN3956_c0_g1_i1:297-1406(-)
MQAGSSSNPINSVKSSVLVATEEEKAKEILGEKRTVRGYDFNEGVDFEKLLNSYLYTGFQATSFGSAVQEVNRMINWRLSDEPIADDEDDELKDMKNREKVRCKIFLGYTSNMASCGVREVIRYLAQHKMVDVIVTTAGGVEEDFIKCLADTYLGDFNLNDIELRKNGMNRIGNLVVPNDNYVLFEKWLVPILDKMLEEQKKENKIWSPSTIINRLGKEINHPDSIYYWCYKNDIPVYCPALTDGSLGDMIFFHSYSNPGLIVDIASDIAGINKQAIYSKKTGMILIGGGVIKHHVCNANLMRNGADYAVFINTGQDYDGSDTGAKPSEAKSWGKIRLTANPVKVFAEATLVFPLLVAQTFAKHSHMFK